MLRGAWCVFVCAMSMLMLAVTCFFLFAALHSSANATSHAVLRLKNQGRGGRAARRRDKTFRSGSDFARFALLHNDGELRLAVGAMVRLRQRCVRLPEQRSG